MLQRHGVLFHVLADCVRRRLYAAELLGVFQPVLLSEFRILF